MKKTLLISSILIVCLLFTGCLNTANKGELIAEYPTDSLPKLLATTDEYWFYLLSEYGSSDYTLAIGQSPDEFEKVHSFSDARVWNMAAEEDTVVWCEDHDTKNVYNMYSVEKGEVTEIFTSDKTNGHQLANMGIYNGNIYYGYTDYSNSHSGIYRYSPESGETTEIFTIPFIEDPCIMALGFDNEYISIASDKDITVINIENGEVVYSYTLEDNIEYVYALSYDFPNGTMGIYYYDQAEQIGVIKDDELLSVFTLNTNHYVYNENILCKNGHLYWISLANVSGRIIDHYVYVDYDYNTHKPVEVKGTFGFVFKNDSTYLLRMGKGAKDLKLYDITK